MASMAMAVGALVSGCGGDCINRVGTYRSEMARRSGNCQPRVEAVIDASNQNLAGCAGPVKTSEDNCTSSADVTCPVSGGGSTRIVGKEEWSTDAKSGSGTMMLTVFDATGTTACQSTYDVTYTKL